MIEKTGPKANPLVHSSRKTQILATLLGILLVITIIVVLKAKTINVHIDGKVVSITTISDSVDGALRYSGLGIYPEDLVVPDRSTQVEKGLEVNVTRSLPLTLYLDGNKYPGRSPQQTVGEALQDISDRLGLNIQQTDEIDIDSQSPLVANMEIEVKRAIPIHVDVDGKEIDTYLAPRTVAEALNKLGITLSEQDKVSLPLDQTLKEDDEIKVVRVTEKEETVTTEIPYQVVAQPADFPVGFPDRTLNKGENGLNEQVVKVTFEDGKEVKRDVQKQEVTKTPVNQVVARGSQTSVSRGGRTINFKRALIVNASAYSSGSITATGNSVRYGVVAVDPRVIPLGSSLYVEGYGDGVALDTGGAIKGNKIDLYMNSEEAARSWGVRPVVVYIK
ncbi:ubiquitin-like domain-containing protein [Desulfitobacterium sp.]|uniref:ubiquitin-like domain-containing protein n=1 Tax=Desulfitobacterium sp. TaxID=49981 RepID=UPI002B202EA2|nr:ubiquitin-like domain-containing protein [Desulfitobacterium sp.]MEA4900221.1 ubiquitin-like domain-containing protein [Desulfitobacterium sp.]